MAESIKKQLCISIEGGGMLGIGPLAFMCRLEEEFGTKLCNLAHAFTGTSTGAIIAACLAEGMSAIDIFDLYKSNLKNIFTKNKSRLFPKQPEYDNTYLKKLLQEKFKGNVSDWEKPIYITTTYMNGQSVEKVWDRGDNDTEKWFAVLTSTAAPTYFDVIMDGNDSYCDGGLWANNPANVVIAGEFKQGNRNLKLLHFNTSMDTPNTETGNHTMLGWAQYLLSDWIARSSKSPIFVAKAILGNDFVFNASPKNEKKFDMDDTSDKTINKVVEIWENYYDSVKDEIKEFMER